MQRAAQTRSIDSFSPTYSEARSRFRAAAEAAGASLETINLPACGPDGLPLTIDVAWIGRERPRRVLLHTSGVHGAEGFTGSAIQLRALAAPPTLPDDAALIVVHCLNPFGMAWLRRTNENNVDLNRNFLLNGARPATPRLYSLINPLLNPASAPRNDAFLLRMLPWLLQHGLRALTQVVAGGQYDHPQGLFYGGDELQPGPRRFLEWLRERFEGVEQLTAIDVHTGLGRFANDVLFVEAGTPVNHVQRLRAAFGARVITQSSAGVMYQCSGSLLGALEAGFPHARVDAVCQEFGTYPSPLVLKALRAENRWHHHGAGALNHRSKRRLREIFNPHSVLWRDSVVCLGEQRLHQAASLLKRY